LRIRLDDVPKTSDDVQLLLEADAHNETTILVFALIAAALTVVAIFSIATHRAGVSARGRVLFVAVGRCHRRPVQTGRTSSSGDAHAPSATAVHLCRSHAFLRCVVLHRASLGDLE
jgi:hypothetical protein